MDKIQDMFDNLPTNVNPLMLRAVLLGLANLEMCSRFGINNDALECVRWEIIASLKAAGFTQEFTPQDVLEYARNEMARLAREM